MKFIEYLKNSFFDYIFSFKTNKRFHYVILADMIYYAIFAAIILIILPVFFLERFGVFYAKLLQYAQVPSEFSGSVQSNLSTQGFYLFLWLIGIFIVITISFALFKGFIWKLIIEKEFSKKKFIEFIKKNFPRYLLIILMLFILFIAIFYLSFSFIKTDMFTIFLLLILFPLYIHILTIFQPVLMINTRFWNSFKKTFAIAFKRIYLFIIPYILISLTFFLVLLIIGGLSYIFKQFSGIITLLFLVLFFNWTKYYLIRIIRPLVK